MKKSKSNGSDDFDFAYDTIDRCCQSQLELLKNITEINDQVFRFWQDYINEQMRRVSQINNPVDLLKAEADLAMDYSSRINECTMNCFETLNSSCKKMMDCFDVFNAFNVFPTVFLDEIKRFESFVEEKTTPAKASQKKSMPVTAGS